MFMYSRVPRQKLKTHNDFDINGIMKACGTWSDYPKMISFNKRQIYVSLIHSLLHKMTCRITPIQQSDNIISTLKR